VDGWSCPVCGRTRGGGRRRSRRGRRTRLASGESELRLAGTVSGSRSVPSRGRLHAVPRRGWQHPRCTASPRRGRSTSAVVRVRLWAPWRPFGVSVVFRLELTVSRRETNRHALRSEGIRSLLSGRVGGDRAVAATSRQGSSRTPHQPGVSMLRDRGDDSIAFAEKPTSTAGNRRRRWCVQPIGHRARVAVSRVPGPGSVGSGGEAGSEARACNGGNTGASKR